MRQKFILRGSSMLPFLRPGDPLVITPIRPDAVRKFQIIAFESKDCKEPVIHRVLKVIKKDEGLVFLTRGDGACLTDPPVTERDLRGKVVGRIENGQVEKISITKEILTYYLSRVLWMVRRVARRPFYAFLNLLFGILPVNFILLKSTSGFTIKVTVFRRLLAQRVVRGERDEVWCHDLLSSPRRKYLEKHLRQYYTCRGE